MEIFIQMPNTFESDRYVVTFADTLVFVPNESILVVTSVELILEPFVAVVTQTVANVFAGIFLASGRLCSFEL